jgi:HSP20 family protein
MTLTRITHDPVMRMIMRNFMNQEQETERRCRWMPATNITEDEKVFYLEMAVPGFSKKDIKISIEKDMLKIFSERTKEENNQEQNYRVREFGQSDFCRTFNLGEHIDQDNIKAEYKDGILSVTLPRKEEVKFKKEIEIV